MPIYEYQCEKCAHVFEEWQSGFDEIEQICPQCGGAAKRLISNTSFVLKGSGWYVTEYGGKRGSESSGGETSDNGNGAESKAETTEKASSGGSETAPTSTKSDSGASSSASDGASSQASS